MIGRRLTYGIAQDQGTAPDDVICIYVGNEQVAGAVRLNGRYAEMTRCEYHVTSHLATGLKPLLCADKQQAIAWLEFLGDLYEGKK